MRDIIYLAEQLVSKISTLDARVHKVSRARHPPTYYGKNREMARPGTRNTVSLRTNAALLISPVEEDHEVLQTLFREYDWTLYSAPSLGPASAALRKNSAPVVITEQHLPVGTWRDVLDVMQLLLDPPLVIVISTHADDRLWAEALNLGAHDVLAKPLDRQETIRVLQWAWHHWTGRRQRAAPTRIRTASS
jgi:FixJ family two-component response regulator